jgi:hypothetical protein
MGSETITAQFQNLRVGLVANTRRRDFRDGTQCGLVGRIDKLFALRHATPCRRRYDFVHDNI